MDPELGGDYCPSDLKRPRVGRAKIVDDSGNQYPANNTILGKNFVDSGGGTNLGLLNPTRALRFWAAQNTYRGKHDSFNTAGDGLNLANASGDGANRHNL